MKRLPKTKLCEGKIYRDLLSGCLVQVYIITDAAVTAQFFSPALGRMENMHIQDGQLVECEETKIPLDVSED